MPLTLDAIGARKLLLTPEEAAETLSITRSRLYDLLRSGELASFKIARSAGSP